jgi:hypothetical protein
VLVRTALGVSCSLLLQAALSGDIGVGLWESSCPRFTTDNLIYDGTESGSESQADLRILKISQRVGVGAIAEIAVRYPQSKVS